MRGVIYGLLLEGDSEIRYVGLTRQKPEKRLWQHLWASRREPSDGKKHRQSVYNWIRKYGEGAIRLQVIEEVEGLEYLNEREKFHIETLPQQGHRLLNLTVGGGNARPTTDEMRRNYSRAQMGHIGYTRGRRMSPEEIERVRISSTGRRHTEESKQKMSEARMGMVFTPEHRENLRLSHTAQRRITDEQIDILRTTPYQRGQYSQLAKEWNVSISAVSKHANRVRSRAEVGL